MEFSTPEIIDGNSYYRIHEKDKKLLNITNDKLIYHPLKMNELNNIISEIRSKINLLNTNKNITIE